AAFRDEAVPERPRALHLQRAEAQRLVERELEALRCVRARAERSDPERLAIRAGARALGSGKPIRPRLPGGLRDQLPRSGDLVGIDRGMADLERDREIVFSGHRPPPGWTRTAWKRLSRVRNCSRKAPRRPAGRRGHPPAVNHSLPDCRPRCESARPGTGNSSVESEQNPARARALATPRARRRLRAERIEGGRT